MFAEEVPEVLKLPAPNRGNREDGIHKNGEARFHVAQNYRDDFDTLRKKE